MLVALREVTRAEVEPWDDVPGVCERFYSLYTNDTSATVADITDGRARRTFNFDVKVSSNIQLTAAVVEPMLRTILTPGQASQAVVVVDGNAFARGTTLFGPPPDQGHFEPGHSDEGILITSIKRILSNTAVATVYLGAVTQQHGNRLVDVFAARNGTPSRDAQEPTILEDVKDEFTSVEDAEYQEVTNLAALDQLVGPLRDSISETKHQVIPIIVAFRDPEKMPNTTLQFVSFASGEMARDMKSTRHCVSTAASLIECRSPIMPFNGTKVSFLLKPALLGSQPGAWISCFSPLSFVPEDPFAGAAAQGRRQQTPGVPPRESFKDAFGVAQMAMRIYSSRIGVTTASFPQLTAEPHQVAHRGETNQVITDSANASDAPSMAVPQSTLSASSSEHANSRPDWKIASEMDRVANEKKPARPLPSVQLEGLVETPSAPRPLDGPPSQEPSSMSHRTDTRKVAGDNCDGEKGDTPSRESALMFEYEAYKKVMEGAMEKLRKDTKDYARRLERAENALAKERETSGQQAAAESRGSTEALHQLEGIVAELRDEVAALRRENASLRAAQSDTQVSHQKEIAALEAEATSLQVRVASEMSAAIAKMEESFDNRQNTSEEVTILTARVKELMDLVSFHQAEIRDYVDTERAYRERLLAMEELLHAERERSRLLKEKLEKAMKSKPAASPATMPTPRPFSHDKASDPLSPTVPAKATTHQRESGRPHPQQSAVESAVMGEMARSMQEALALAERERQERKKAEAALDAIRQRRDRQQVHLESEDTLGSAAGQGSVGSDKGNTNYDRQLEELKLEMMDFKQRLEKRDETALRVGNTGATRSPSDIHVLGTSTAVRGQAQPVVAAEQNFSTVHAANAEQVPPSHDTEPSWMRGGRAGFVRQGDPRSYSGSGRTGPGDETSVLSGRSQLSSRPRPPMQRRTQSFEEFMEEEPEYKLRQSIQLNTGPRTSRFRV